MKNIDAEKNLVEEKVGGEEVYSGVLLHVWRDEVRLPNGHLTAREWVKHPGAAAVLPLTDAGEAILVRQYRYPVGRVTLEVPAGKLDKADEGETPLGCAVRELSEETGYSAAEYIHLTDIETTVGFTNEKIYIYLARGLERGEQHPDDDEFINVVKMPLKDAVAKVLRGEIADSKTIIALLLAERMMKKGSF